MSCWSLVRKDIVTDTIWDRREKEGHRPGDLGIGICVGDGRGYGGIGTKSSGLGGLG